ncbi:MAG: PHP domain-containing protein [Dehalococcoidia bacterium]|nr:PHP domain-containing protein [Dehalococcoidia bacterium]MDW8120318.1 PHP domain-containing protein [Chloroflexota bacterium]
MPSPVLADLHLHTTASDGRLRPTALVRLCAQRGLRVIAITDHDTTDGLAEARAEVHRHPHMTLIPGVEFSTDVPGEEIHLLGYFLREEDGVLQEVLHRLRQGRIARAHKMLERLRAFGMDIRWERVLEIAGGASSVGRPHIAQAMLEKGYVSSLKEAFDRWIGRHGPAYVERDKFPPAEAIRFIRQRGGIPALAHPRDITDLPRWLKELKEAGLAGMEVYYGDYTSDQVSALLALAREHALLPVGGSDYHAFHTPGEVEPGSVGPPWEVVEGLFALSGKQPVSSSPHPS